MITAFTLQVTTTCNINYSCCQTTELYNPIPVGDIFSIELPQNCQPAHFSVIAHSDAGMSQPSPPATISGRFVVMNNQFVSEPTWQSDKFYAKVK